MTLFIVLLQVLLTVGLAVSSLPPAAALSYCYFGLPFMNRKDTRENDVRLLPVNFLEYPYCFSYQQQCTQNMAPDVCSQTEVDQGNVWKWYFGLSYSKFPRCEEYVGQLQAPDSQAATYRNYTCCTTDGCNLPLPSKAPGKRVLPYPVDLFPSSMEHPRPNPTCYDNLFSDDGTLMPVVSSIEYTGHNEANANYVCARFKYQCAEAGVYCSAEEQAEHHTKWIYTSVTADNCFGWQSSAELYNMSQVTCCAHPRCNAVEPTMDPTTLVLPEPSPTAINITCYTSIADPTDPNSPPMVYPVTYPARLGDGNTTQATVCSSFSYDRCTNAMPDRQLQCSAAEAEAGVWETLYFAGTTGDCYKGHLDGTNGLNNRVCCAEDNCNDPTDAMDDKAKVIALPASGQLTCYGHLDIRDPMSDNIPPAVYPVTQPATVAGSMQGTLEPAVCASFKTNVCKKGGKNCTESEASQGVWKWQYLSMPISACYEEKINGYGNTSYPVQDISCCSEPLCNMPQADQDSTTQVFNISPPSHNSIWCFTSVNSSTGTPAVKSIQYNSTATYNKTLATTEPFVCASYKFDLCPGGPGSCGVYRYSAGVGHTAYVPIPISQCYQMQWLAQQNGLYLSIVTCCSGDHCNKPADNTTEILPSFPAGPSSCYIGEPGLAGEARPPVFLKPVPSNEPWLEAYGCTSYQSLCLHGDSACTQDDVAAGVYKWHYKVLTPSFCQELQSASWTKGTDGVATYQIVRCCNQDGCNAPDPDQDPHTGGELTCYQSLVSDPATGGTSRPEYYPGAMAVTKWSNHGGPLPLVCAKFAVECTSEGTGYESLSDPNFYDRFCSKSEVSNKTVKWFYTHADAEECRQWQESDLDAQSLNSTLELAGVRVTNFTCCLTNRCNKPSVSDDTYTKLLPEPAPGSELMCYEYLLPDYPDNNPVVAPAVFAREFPSYVTDVMWGSHAPWREPVACVTYHYHRCPTESSASPDVVAACKAENADRGLIGTMYTVEALSKCYGYWNAWNNGYFDFTCCTEDRCNSPEAAKDSRPKVLEVNNGTDLACYTNMVIQDPFIATVRPAVYLSTTNTSDEGCPLHSDYDCLWRTSKPPYACASYKVDTCQTQERNCTAAEAHIGAWEWHYQRMPLVDCYRQQQVSQVNSSHPTQSVKCCTTNSCNQPDPTMDSSTQVFPVTLPAQVDPKSTISCFTSVNATYGTPSAVQSMQYNATATYNQTLGFTEPFVCASYKFKLCEDNDPDCSSTLANTPGMLSTAYIPLPLSQCYQLQWMAQQHDAYIADVTCCATNNCNMPTDSSVQIIPSPYYDPGQSACPQGKYTTTTALGAIVEWSTSAVLPTAHSSGAGLAYLDIQATMDPLWEQQQQQLGQRFVYWKTAMLPLKPAASPPPSNIGIPAMYQQVPGSDGRCQVSHITVPLFGGYVEVYVHTLSTPYGTVYLEVWAQAGMGIDRSRSVGHVGPGGWFRASTKFISALQTDMSQAP